jgi:hypothetical protein
MKASETYNDFEVRGEWSNAPLHPQAWLPQAPVKLESSCYGLIANTRAGIVCTMFTFLKF